MSDYTLLDPKSVDSFGYVIVVHNVCSCNRSDCYQYSTHAATWVDKTDLAGLATTLTCPIGNNDAIDALEYYNLFNDVSYYAS